MAGAELARRDEGDDLGREGEEAQGVGDRRAGLADALGELFLREVILVHQLLHGGGGLDGVEVFALQIFDEGDFFDLAVVVLAHHDGDLLLARDLGGAIAALAGDDHVFAVRHLIDDDGHDEAVLFDGVCQLVEGGFVKVFARLVGIGADEVDIYFLQPLDVFGQRLRQFCTLCRVPVRLFGIRKQCGQPSAQSSGWCFHNSPPEMFSALPCGGSAAFNSM